MVNEDPLLALHREMVRIRIFEETLVAVYQEGKSPAFDIAAGPVPGEMHLAAGQEPVAAGVCAHLRPTDAVTATHRPHHVALAHGVDMKRMAAEIFGKETGLGRGKGGHMHLFLAEPVFGCSGIVAEGIPTAVGHALAFKKQGRDDIRRLVLQRRCGEPGRIPRIAQPRGSVAPARGVRVRGQRLGDQRAQGQGDRDQQQQRPRGRLRHAGRADTRQRPGCHLRDR